MARSLDGLSILVVEDEILIGMMFRDAIERAGGTSIGPINSIQSALKIIESQGVDAVILDAKLVDGSAECLAAALGAHRIPYVVASGYEQVNLPAPLKHAPFVAKPVSLPLLVEAVEDLTRVSRRSRSPQDTAGRLAVRTLSPASDAVGASTERRQTMSSTTSPIPRANPVLSEAPPIPDATNEPDSRR